MKRPERFEAMARTLFAAMRTGGLVGFEEVAWFDGGLFDSGDALPLEKEDIDQALRAATLDWAEIDPSIFGTLFERGLDPDKRSQLGAHYTDRDKIMLIVGPVIVEPLTREWEETRRAIRAALDRAAAARSPSAATRAQNDAQALHTAFLERLRRFRVLDPACGSGNFLYLALLALKELEHRVNLDAEALGFQRPFPAVGPEAVRGIEINPYAAELARVSVWIGEIQWMRRNGFAIPGNPILRPLETIECRDALLNEDGTEAGWPEADAIIGNPPFLGVKRMYAVLGEAYTSRLRAAFPELSQFSDLVGFWFDKALRQVRWGQAQRVGLVATNSLRGGRNRLVLDRIAKEAVIFDAWSDEPWVIEGAAVRVSLICFCQPQSAFGACRLNGRGVFGINADLTFRDAAAPADLTKASRLRTNLKVGFVGTVKGGAFEVSGQVARDWLQQPLNPNGRPNSDVLRPWLNGLDVIRRPRDIWIVDFGTNMSLSDASLYVAPFGHVLRNVKPHRDQVRNPREVQNWWIFSRALPSLREAISSVKRYIATPVLAKHRIFVWLDSRLHPDHQLMVVARDDDTTLGILHSRFHELWTLRLCTWLGVGNDPRYTPSTTFETFPFPDGLTPDVPASRYADEARAQRIAAAARRLDELRGAWLNPPDLVRRVPEVVPGYPDRLLPVDDKAAAILRKRTLTNLYNERPAWLANAHRELDEAVAAAYGWPADLSDGEVLARLLALNQAASDRS